MVGGMSMSSELELEAPFTAQQQRKIEAALDHLPFRLRIERLSAEVLVWLGQRGLGVRYVDGPGWYMVSRDLVGSVPPPTHWGLRARWEPDAVIAGLRVFCRLAQGTFGQIYDTVKGDTRIVVKVVEHWDAGIAELQALREVRDVPDCGRLLSWFECNGEICMVQPYHGERMRHLTFPAATVASFGIEIMTTLAECHQRNVVHADLKPENLLLGDDGAVTIIDFGCACSGPPPYSGKVCTFPYRAPEIFLNKPFTAAIDVYSAACCLYELVIGRTLMRDHGDLHKLEPGLFKQTLERMLSMQPEDRPTALEAVTLLKNAHANMSGS